MMKAIMRNLRQSRQSVRVTIVHQHLHIPIHHPLVRADYQLVYACDAGPAYQYRYTDFSFPITRCVDIWMPHFTIEYHLWGL
jgi:hypothetical protein